MRYYLEKAYFCIVVVRFCPFWVYYIIMDSQSAYTELLRRHWTMIWGLCWVSAKGNYERCRDLVQDVSIALWLRFDKLRPDASAQEERAWVRWQTRSVIDFMRRQQRPSPLPLTDEVANTIATDNQQRQQELLEYIMASLSPDEQRMMRLRMEGYRADEIASILGLNRDAVYQRMHRAVVKVRKVLLMLFLLLVLSTLAIAVVPSWRKAMIEKVRQKEEKEVQQADESDTKLRYAGMEGQTEEKPLEEKTTAPVRVERLPDADAEALISCVNGECDTLPVSLETMLPEPIIVVSTRQIIVTGIYGERVSVYVQGGALVSSQVCNGICVVGFLRDGVSYRIQIGRRKAVILDM